MSTQNSANKELLRPPSDVNDYKEDLTTMMTTTTHLNMSNDLRKIIWQHLLTLSSAMIRIQVQCKIQLTLNIHFMVI